MAEQPETEPTLLVYVGQRLDAKDKLIGLWLTVTPEEFENGTVLAETEVSRRHVYEGSKTVKRYITGQPGSVYEVPKIKGKDSILAGEAKYQGLWPDDARRMEWQALSRAETTTAALWKKAKQEGSEDNFSSLEPFRKAYRKLVSQDQRAALIAQVIAYITA